MAPPICKFFQSGHCRNGANCRFDHPGSTSTSNPFSAASSNPFSALSSAGGGGRKNTTKDGANPYKITADQIETDLSDERPGWILSAYGPGKDAPEQLFGGYPREQSFEEIRLHVTSSPDPQKALQEVGEIYQQAEQQMKTALSNLDGALEFIFAAENQPRNRNQTCKQLSSGQKDVFPKGGASTGFPSNPLNSGSSANQDPFSTTQANPFGGGPSASAAAPGVFGQPSTLGQKPSPFGTPAFGQPSQPGTSGSAFGQSSTLGNAGSAFGQPSKLGGTGSAFGQPSTLGNTGSAFGQPSKLGGTVSAFGQTSQLGSTSSAFGQPSQLGNTPSAFGQPSALGAKPSPFGGNPSGSSAFSQANSQPSAFGKPSVLGTNSSPFATTSAPPNPFGAASQTPNATPAPNPFGQASQPSSGFGQKPPNPFGAATTTAMDQSMDTATAPGTVQAPNSFGKPASSGFGAPTTNGFGGDISNGIAASNAPSPYAPNSTKQHPNVSITSDGVKLTSFKGQRVVYKDNKPGVQNPDNSWRRIWMPKGPPNYTPTTEPEDPSLYDANVKAAYQAMANNGYRFQGDMPTVPPMREDCLWDF